MARIADDVHYGRVRPADVNPAWNVDPRENAPPLDSTLAVIAGSGSVERAIDAQRPQHFIYRGLMGSSSAYARSNRAAAGPPCLPDVRSHPASVTSAWRGCAGAWRAAASIGARSGPTPPATIPRWCAR